MMMNQRHIIYNSYKFAGLNLFFRDRNLSDTISFVYSGWEDPVFAANDLLEHFKRIHYYVKNIYADHVVPIIMDGENAWEYYKNNGIEFLETIYSALEKSEIISSTTPSEFLSQHQSKELFRLASGSWINSDFGVWIGSKKNNLYWYILIRLKDMIEKSKISKEKKDEARQCLHLIEGSDWFWWNTFEDKSGEFKKLFVAYVEKIYKLCGKKPHAYLYKL
jgi:alpha-amylase/alpha-mannosidase (GH57 family)